MAKRIFTPRHWWQGTLEGRDWNHFTPRIISSKSASQYAVILIQKGHAYVCDLNAEDTDAYRGAPDRPGKESPWRNRSVAESLDLFQRMKAGEFPDGARTLRARNDMALPNVWLRDPFSTAFAMPNIIIPAASGASIPMYDFAHCLSDYWRGITHSICTLEFEVHRPLYDWILEKLGLPAPCRTNMNSPGSVWVTR